MLLSTLVVLNQLNIVNNASAQPGVDEWGYATEEIVYGVSYAKNTIEINTTGWTTGIHYLYYPSYNCSTGAGRPATSFSWDGPFENAEGQIYVDATDADDDLLYTYNQAITFNRSGMWILDDDDSYDIDDPASFDGYIWVNSSMAYTISSVNDFAFGSTDDVTIEVKEGDVLANCRFALIDPEGTTILNSATGGETVDVDADEFMMAGDYTVRAYRDIDEVLAAYYYSDEVGDAAYNESYGSGAYFDAIYNYTTIGPWDPPEKMAEEKTFTVTTAKPTMVLTNTTLYWGYAANIDVNITAPDGTGIEASTDDLAIRAPDGTYYFESDFTYFDFVDNGLGNYTIVLQQWNDTNDADWDMLDSGTFYIVFGYDAAGDTMEEWNSSVGSMNRFVVKTTLAPVQLKIVDDGDGDTNKKVDIPMFTDGNGIEGIEIIFNITGTSITNDGGRLYYGDDTGEDWRNITVTGDLLWPVDENYNEFEDILWYEDADGWHLYVLPTKPGDSITIAVDWPGDDNGTDSEAIEIVNGSFVTTNFDTFAIGENVTLTVTAKDMDQEVLKYADVYLVWQADAPFGSEDDAFNSTTGDNSIGNGRNGEYTFLVDTDQMGTWAPRDLTVAINDDSSGLTGYHNVVMERNHNMRVNITPVTGYAGDSVEYDIMVSLLGGGDPDEDGLSVMIYNVTGDEVTDPAIVSGIWPIDDDASITDHEIILAAGTYYLYAYNDTHDSQGYNATITISSYTVTSSPSVLAWLIDTATNITFQVTPATDGTLKLLNMTSTNGTWLDREVFVDIENGTGILDEINATTLGNVTYEFEPSIGGDYRHAEGLLRVTTATATPNPVTIYLGEPTIVTITITHPATGAPIEDVRVGLDHGMSLNESILAKLPSDIYTDAAGRVQFSISADASGDIIIYIENETDPDNEFVISAEARKPMTISLNPSVDEGKTFTVEAKTNGVLITGTTVTFTFDGQTWPTTTGVATLTAPTVSTSMAYSISATAEGFIPATGAIVMILNIPKLIVAVSGEVKAGQTFTLTIADDTGSAVIGATITFEGKTYTSGAGGVVTITAPSTEGSYPVTATFPGYDPISATVTVAKGAGVPGFEMLTLLAAIGVAFLLLRRRRN